MSETDASSSLNRKFWIGLGALLLFSLVTKWIRLGYPSNFYFDEVYHAFTATRYLHSDAEAYSPWGAHPAGVAYEWTHPPLAKLLMTGFMLIFGENSFGWRFGSTLFGTLSIGLTALVAFELFGSAFIAWLSAFFLTFEGLHFTQSRIAMNDSYFVCFMLFGLLFYLKWKKNPNAKPMNLYWSAIGLGLAAATKWTTLYVFMLIFIDITTSWFFYRQRPKTAQLVEAALAFTVIPAVIYLASYLQMFMQGRDLGFFWTVQKQMWYYHSQLKATHSYQSKPYQWVLNLRPVWMFVHYSEGRVGNIYNIGNGIVLWMGLFAAWWGLFKERNWTHMKRFLFIAYFILWAPWMLSPRIMLFYHYLPAIPFLCIILARYLSTRVDLRVITICLTVFWFVLFYPHMTAIDVPKEFADAIYFLWPGWK